jgi:hypothetical protein
MYVHQSSVIDRAEDSACVKLFETKQQRTAATGEDAKRRR